MSGKKHACLVQKTEYAFQANGKKLSSPVRLAFLSDLHCEDFGPDQQPLIDLLISFRPHAVLIGGDAYDERRPWDKANETIRLCADRFPTYYTPGNHEVKTKKLRQCREQAVENGAFLLAGTAEVLQADGSEILLCGAEDPLNHEEEHQRQMDACAQAVLENSDLYSVLMTHRPERTDEYRTHPADLILTGHAHGGQWRFFWAKSGVYAPDQGFFPPKTGGVFRRGDKRTVVSRGLGNVTPFPRFGNPPETVCITILPADDGAADSCAR